jgi:hypothetical protein
LQGQGSSGKRLGLPFGKEPETRQACPSFLYLAVQVTSLMNF